MSSRTAIVRDYNSKNETKAEYIAIFTKRKVYSSYMRDYSEKQNLRSVPPET